MITLKRLASIAIALGLGWVASAQQTSQTSQLPKESLQLPQTLDYELEQLLQRWYDGYTARSTAPYANPRAVPVPNVADTVYINMMNKIPSGIKLSYNSIVRESIELYLYRRRPLLSLMLSLGDLYFPDIESELDRHGLPLELKYLTIVESSLNPSAISPAGAVGLWQFMLPTARLYGLQVNSLVDERMDPIKSTEAACKFLKDLYRIYKDWWLVMAAYNCGSGNVNRAIVRAGGGQKSFWDIYAYLPRETRKYVPLFIGVYYSMYYSKHYGIQPRELGRTLATEYYEVRQQTSFSKIASITGMTQEQIKAYNPQFRRGIVPGNIEPYQLRLPLKAVMQLEGYSSEDLKSEEMAVSEDRVSGASLAEKRTTAEDRKRYVYHRVGRRETVEQIARRYGVTAKQIRSWNNFGRRGLRQGASIIVGVKEEPTKKEDVAKRDEQAEDIVSTAKQTPHKREGDSSTVSGDHKSSREEFSTPDTDRKISVETKKSYTYHRVGRRETVEQLARRYGVTVKQIRSWNNLGRRGLRRGANIIVGVKDEPKKKELPVKREEYIEDTVSTAKLTNSKVENENPTPKSEHRVNSEQSVAVNSEGKTHIVRRGETLISIAMRYNTTVAQIKDVNKLKSDVVKVGDELLIPSQGGSKVSKARTSADEPAGTKGREQAQQAEVETRDNTKGKKGAKVKDEETAPKKSKNQDKSKTKTYKVKAGDTPSKIAKKMGISLKELRKLNNLKSDRIDIGQELKIKK